MSRIGNLPIEVPRGVEVTLAADRISIKGPLGTVSQALSGGVEVKREGDQIVFHALDRKSVV